MGRAFTLLILLYMAGALTWDRVWMLAGGAVLAAAVTVSGPPAWAADLRLMWFIGLATWLAPPLWPAAAAHRVQRRQSLHTHDR